MISTERSTSSGGSKGSLRSGRKWVNLMPEKFTPMLVSPVYLLRLSCDSYRRRCFAVIGGYPKLRTRLIARPRNAAQRSGTRGASTAGHEKRGSRRGVVAGQPRRRTYDPPTAPMRKWFAVFGALAAINAFASVVLICNGLPATTRCLRM
jgi:hypothetical protein